ncbi:MAG: hypothetical protein ACXW1Z_20590 [Methylobacter sp.]
MYNLNILVLRRIISTRARWLPDVAIGGTLAAIAAGMSLLLNGWIGDFIFSKNSQDLWFNADTARVFENLTSRHSDHYRTKVHPLFSLFVSTPTIGLIKVIGLSPIHAVLVSMLAAAAAATALLYTLLRQLSPRFDATLYTAVFLSSVGFIFWFSVPETYPWGAVSILATVLAATLVPFGRWPSVIVIASAFSLAFTVTNWMAGLVAAFQTQPWRRAVRLSIYAFALVAFLTPIQNFLYPRAGQFLNVREERDYVKSDYLVSIPTTVATFFVKTIIAPKPELKPMLGTIAKGRSYLTAQTSAGSGSAAGIAAVLGWLSLFVLGLWGIVRRKVPSRLSLAVFLVLLGQFMLYLVYGGGPFLYSAHYVPLLVIVAAFASTTPARWIALVLAVLVVVAGGINNIAMFKEASALLLSQTTEHDKVRHAMLERPGDPWPRGRGHVPFGLPGTAEHDKAYLEPGGAFSPSVGSFGISVWVLDSNNQLITTSDALSLQDIKERFHQKDGLLPSVVTDTPFYRATWALVSPVHWRLVLTPKGEKGKHLAVALRSVGPAAGPITSLSLRDNRLWINNRWRLEATPGIELAYLGEEGSEGWTRPTPSKAAANVQSGWGHARLWVDPNAGLNLDIHDTTSVRPSGPFASLQARSGLQLVLPDPQFVDALEAQVTHLMMGLVDRETRPGEPITYPLAWQRDGAYVVVSLLHAGRADVARELVRMFAEVDFFGGFGAEADAPGLSLWAIAAVADALHEPTFDTDMWPHVIRKAEMILELLSTQKPVHKPFSGKASPGHARDPDLNLVANAADQGLIIGRMDWHFPLLYVNGVSYRGLMDASRLAARRGERERAQRWRSAAESLRRAWNRALTSPEQDNPRTLISGIWPTFVVAEEARFERALNQAWELERTGEGGFRQRPLWTYFDLAQAHQWLYLARPERAWSTLKWFWKESPAPGLYTQWEGKGGNEGEWTQVRGWVNPPPITPHYWAAAEMLSLQLAMLAYYDARPEVDSVVIGSGVPSSWFNHPMRVSGLITAAGRIDWEWSGDTVAVHVEGNPVKVRLGPQFPAHTRLKTTFSSSNAVRRNP